MRKYVATTSCDERARMYEERVRKGFALVDMWEVYWICGRFISIPPLLRYLTLLQLMGWSATISSIDSNDTNVLLQVIAMSEKRAATAMGRKVRLGRFGTRSYILQTNLHSSSPTLGAYRPYLGFHRW